MQHKTAIIYVITKLELGGAQKVCLSLFEKEQSETTDTFLISGTEGPLVEKVLNNPHVIFLPSLLREISFKDISAFFALFRTIKKIKKQYAHTIVHTHSTKAGYLGRWAAWCAGIQTIIHTVHGFGFHPYQSKLGYLSALYLERLTNTITTSYICVSSADIQTGITKLARFKHKCHLIRAAIEDALFTPAHKELIFDGICTFGTVACFKPQKNIFDLLEAFKRVHTYYPKTRLEIIGDGLQRPLIEQWIQTHHLQKVIILHGWQLHPVTIMKTWDCFVLSSLWEGLPCALVEARFLQIPVVAYNVGGISDIITHGKNGYLCSPENKSLLAHYMELIAKNNYVRKQLGEYKDDLQTFTNDSMITQHTQLYQQISFSS